MYPAVLRSPRGQAPLGEEHLEFILYVFRTYLVCSSLPICPWYISGMFEFIDQTVFWRGRAIYTHFFLCCPCADGPNSLMTSLHIYICIYICIYIIGPYIIYVYIYMHYICVYIYIWYIHIYMYIYMLCIYTIHIYIL